MSVNLKPLLEAPRLLLEAKLQPVQGSRFQPTGFPDLGAATFNGFDENGGTVACLLVESAQSMANRLENVCWDEANADLIEPLSGLPFVRSTLPNGEVTDSIRESHRLNSPYIVNSEEFKTTIEPAIGFEANKPFDRRKLANALMRFDPNSLIHGTFLVKVGGTVRLPRVLSGFVEADDVRAVQSGGAKLDRIQPGASEGKAEYGSAEDGYGNIIYHRTEFVAKRTTAYFNLDLAQLHGYGLSDEANELLTVLALFKIRQVLHSGLRLRTACDFDATEVKVTRPNAFELPSLDELKNELPTVISACKKTGVFADPSVTDVAYVQKKKK